MLAYDIFKIPLVPLYKGGIKEVVAQSPHPARGEGESNGAIETRAFGLTDKDG